MPMRVLGPVVVGYILGSIPFAYMLTSRLRGVDVRTIGSGNPGAANVYRTSGPVIGLEVLALDLTKGATAVLLAEWFADGPVIPAAAGVAAIIGHIYPIWLRFRGGKGVATACGAFAVLAPLATAIAGVAFVIAVWWTRYVSIGSVVAMLLLGPVAFLTGAPKPVAVGAVMSAVIILHRHRGNLARVRGGNEHRIGERSRQQPTTDSGR